MSIEKLTDNSRSQIQRTPFTQISNEVITHIKDNDAFRVYAYLQSKSQNWNIIKSHLEKVCGIGQRKMKQIFSYLNRANLLRYVRVIDALGKVVKIDIQVLNGTEFLPDVAFHSKDNQKTELSTENQSTGAETARAETHWCGNVALQNKDNALNNYSQKSDLKIEKPKPTGYIERNTMTDEAKMAEFGNVRIAEHYLSNLKGIPKLKRYQNG